jgi:hypothetical protein
LIAVVEDESRRLHAIMRELAVHTGHDACFRLVCPA